jgi:ATP-dependent DNA helicase RecQ
MSEHEVLCASLNGVVERTWGFSSLRPLQREVMEAILGGRDSLLVIPTGGGKSLCYQAPAILLDGLTVVVSPLLALMKDQVDALRSVGVAAAAWNSMTTTAGQREIERTLADASLRLLFVSPERLASTSFRGLLQKSRVRAFAIDEAHCISHWGHDFRPEYRQLRELRGLFPNASIHAFTATATQQVRNDICSQLALRDPLIFLGDLDRPNLVYRVLPRRDELRQVEEVIRRHPGDAGIVYCIRRKDVDTLASALASRGHRVAPYHAGMDPNARREAQDDFTAERVDVIVATVAFGMGIDRSNIRFVVHAGMPKSLEHYQQEAGRAGRDGLAAECLLLHHAADASTWTRILEHSGTTDDQLTIALRQLDAMSHYCVAASCRHRALVEHFGGTWTNDKCGACDVCLQEQEKIADSTTIARKILSCVVRVNESFGAGHLTSVLRGEHGARVLQWRHDRLSTYGLLREFSRDDIRTWIAQLIAKGALRQEGDLRPIVKLGTTARAILRGDMEVALTQPGRSSEASDAADWLCIDRDLFDALRAWRRDVADRKGVAPFVVFGDRTLREIAAVRPSTPDRLRLIGGIGDLRMREHGDALMAIVDAHSEARGLARDNAPPPTFALRGRSQASRITPAKAESRRLFAAGATVEEVMVRTGRARSTAVRDLSELIEEGRIEPDVSAWVDAAQEDAIRTAARECGYDRLSPIKEVVGPDISYEAIHLVVAAIRASGRDASFAPPPSRNGDESSAIRDQ